MIEVITPGALATIQDRGRFGYTSSGVGHSGPMDPFAMRAANMLVGNDANAAVLEATLTGPTLRTTQDCLVAITGARLASHPHHETFLFSQGTTLDLGRCDDGVRSYVAFAGGIDVEPVLGSRSTHVAAGLGPPPLRVGGRFELGRTKDTAKRVLAAGVIPAHSSEMVVRAITGATLDARGFFDGSFTVSARADRTGIRLEGAPLEGREIDPEPTSFGAVQIPPDGTPIVLMADRPVTGGYATIANIIAADIGLLARSKPGDTVRFVPVTIEQAREAFAQRERALVEGIRLR